MHPNPRFSVPRDAVGPLYAISLGRYPSRLRLYILLPQLSYYTSWLLAVSYQHTP
jgi:hypothetical protein